MLLRKVVEWNMGHRIPGHKTDRNLHGHRFKLLVEIVGSIDISTGLIIDLRVFKSILRKQIVDILDHSFIISSKDKRMLDFFQKNSDLRHLIIENNPTCENILLWIYQKLDIILKKEKIVINKIILWESETSSAALDSNIQNGNM